MKWSLEQGEGAGEMVHCLGTLVALAEDQGFRESDEIFGQPPTHTHIYTHTCTHTYTHNRYNLKKNLKEKEPGMPL